MSIVRDYAVAMAACTLFASAAFAQTARDIRGPSPRNSARRACLSAKSARVSPSSSNGADDSVPPPLEAGEIILSIDTIFPASPCNPRDKSDGGEGTQDTTAFFASAMDSAIGSCHATP